MIEKECFCFSKLIRELGIDMLNFPWSSWIRQAFTRKSSRRSLPRRQSQIETLESRALLSATNEILYFTAYHPDTGNELWMSNGDTGGTQLVADINPGPNGSDPGGDFFYPFFVSLNNKLIFTADDGVHGTEVWVTDGIGETKMLVDAVTFEGDQPAYSYGVPRDPVIVGGKLYYTLNDLDHGRELWVTDGTTEGTHLVKDINLTPRTNPTFQYGSYPTGLREHNGLLYFTADDGVHGAELWRSDGTSEGTYMVADVRPGAMGSYPGGGYYGRAMEIVGNKLYFLADDGTHGNELWVTDGTSQGTQLVADINPGVASSNVGAPDSDYLTKSGFLVVGDVFYFPAFTANEGVELWKSDGTQAGTQLVRDINPGMDSSFPGGEAVQFLTVVGDWVLFTATDPDHGTELWRTDGTALGTTLVKDINPNQDDDYYGYSSYPGGADTGSNFKVWNGAVYFSAHDGEAGFELWRSDGTTEGTYLLSEINPGEYGSYPGGYGSYTSIPGFYELNGKLYFPAQTDDLWTELWSTDGTVNGTTLVKDINPGDEGGFPGGYGGFSYGTFGFVKMGGYLYFSAIDGFGMSDHGAELWRTDGTTEGTTLVADISPGSGDSEPGGDMGNIMVLGTLGEPNATPEINPMQLTLAENSPAATVVGTVVGTDADEDDTLTYRIIGDNSGGAFAINLTTGAITVANPANLNFEVSSGFSVTVEVEDAAGATDTAVITITLTNVNEAPTMGTGAFTSEENAANGTAIGTVAGGDPDADDTLTYSIVGGNDGGAFTINPSTGAISVANATALDFETTPAFTLTVRATDSGGLSGDNTVTVTLTDVNDAPQLTSSPGTTTVSKKGLKSGPAAIAPNLLVLDPDVLEDFKVGGGTLVISINILGKQSKKGFTPYDTIGGVSDSAIATIGVGSLTTIGDRVQYTIELHDATTAGQVQSFLNQLSFSTAKKGAKKGSTREFRAQLTDNDGAASQQLTQTITMAK